MRLVSSVQEQRRHAMTEMRSVAPAPRALYEALALTRLPEDDLLRRADAVR